MKTIFTLLVLLTSTAQAVIVDNQTVEGELTMSGKTASTVPYLDGSKQLQSSAVTPTELGYVSGVTSALQTQLNGKEPTITAATASDYYRGDKSFQNLGTAVYALIDQSFSSVTQIVYVREGGNDLTGTGSIFKPYATVEKALSMISDATTSKRYQIDIGAGQFDETLAGCTLKPYVYLVGQGHTHTRMTCVGNAIVAGAGFAAGGTSRAGIRDIYLTGTTGVNIDLPTVGGVGGSQMILDIFDVQANGSIIYKGRSGNLDSLQMWNSFAQVGSVTIDSTPASLLFNTIVAGSVTISGSVSGNSTEVSSVSISSNLSVSSTIGNTNVSMRGSRIGGTAAVTGAAAVLSADAASLPALKASTTTASGGTLTAIENAQFHKYEPGTPADWSVAPSLVGPALDSLALNKLNASALVQTITNGDTTHTSSSDALYDALALKRDLNDSSAYYVGPVGTGRPYTTISAALTAMGAATSEADFEKARVVYISGGAYDENITIPRGRIITLVAEGTVILGDGVGANFGSTTARSITFEPDSADLFGSDIKPALNLVGTANNDPTSTFLAEAGGFIISGNLAINGSGVSHTVNLSNTKISGSITKTTLGLTNLQGYKLLVSGASNLSAGSTILERCYDCEFGGLLTIDGYNAIINSEIKAGMTVVNNFNTLPPSGMFFTTFTGTFTGPANSLKLDLASDYFFRANGATLAGGATKVILSPVATASVSGILSSTDFSTFNGKQDALVNSAGLAAALSDETGTGSAVFSASPALTGNPTAPTQTAGDNSTKIATTAYADAAAASAGSAAVIDSIADADTTHAPSRNSVFDALALKESLANKNANNGYAGLDAGGKIPSSLLPNTVMEYQGNWNANTNTPALANGTGNAGDVYRANVAGTTDFGAGGIAFNVGDWAVYNGSIWEYAANSNLVSSVNGQQGTVVLDTDDIAEGANLYFTEARVLGTDLAGFSSGSGTVTSADTVLSAFNKLDGNIGLKQNLLTNSAGLAAALSDETGTGLAVFATSPTLVTPNLGTPSALVGTNITGTAASFNIGGNAGTATALAANPTDCAGGQYATAIDAQGNLTCAAVVAGVSSVFGRTGAVVSANGDYTGSQVTNVAYDHIAATTVQAAINELVDEKERILEVFSVSTTQLLAPTSYRSFYKANVSGGAISLTLPLAAGLNNRIVTIKNISNSNDVTVVRNVPDNIEGGTSDTIGPHESRSYIADAATDTWYTIND